ncbi:hypothetical protein C5E45_32880 [Nocardia nova]|uniref:Uncharacterized protein n=2 Tax=Nocardia nova TaxID=37330 RepID=A0A2S6ACY4_9NOCA|nr:hypothetical protein C5E45_32880 [Nocardia nova]
MPIVDDYYRARDGEEWHYECWNQPPVTHGVQMPDSGEKCDICGKEAWRKHEGVLLCGACWNVALKRGEVAGHADHR